MKSLIQTFYQAFQDLDPETMATCYHDEIHFEDPGFGVLKGPRASNMWRMLLHSQKGKDFRIVFSDIQADEKKGSAHWEAHYNFSQTGRRVHNKIDAKFEFKEGKIIKHIDHFNLHNWAGQALGMKGKLLGWTSFFQKKLHIQTNKLLDNYESKHA